MSKMMVVFTVNRIDLTEKKKQIDNGKSSGSSAD